MSLSRTLVVHCHEMRTTTTVSANQLSWCAPLMMLKTCWRGSGDLTSWVTGCLFLQYWKVNLQESQEYGFLENFERDKNHMITGSHGTVPCARADWTFS